MYNKEYFSNSIDSMKIENNFFFFQYYHKRHLLPGLLLIFNVNAFLRTTINVEGSISIEQYNKHSQYHEYKNDATPTTKIG